jgi:hypothetical protein
VNNKALLAVIQPTGTNVVEAEASFVYAQGGPLAVVDELLCLVTARRSYQAGFYADTLLQWKRATNSPSTSSQEATQRPERPRILPTTTRTVRSG